MGTATHFLAEDVDRGVNVRHIRQDAWSDLEFVESTFVVLETIRCERCWSA